MGDISISVLWNATRTYAFVAGTLHQGVSQHLHLGQILPILRHKRTLHVLVLSVLVNIDVGAAHNRTLERRRLTQLRLGDGV